MSVLVPHPFGNLSNIDSLFETWRKDLSCLQIPLEVFHKEDHWLVKAYIPGVSKDNIHVDVENGRVIISAVRPKPEDKLYLSEIEYGELKTKVNVSGLAHIKKENVSASYTDGVLSVVIKKDADSVPYTVEIQ